MPHRFLVSLKLSLMKLMNKINPKRLFCFCSKKSSLSRSDISSASAPNTPISIIPTTPGFKVTIPQIENLLTRLQIDQSTHKDISHRLTKADVDENGFINLKEFGDISSEARGVDLREVFDIFDRDHDGKITAEELHEVFVELMRDEECDLEECRRIVAEAGTSGDGFICLEDFKRTAELEQ